MAVFQALTLTAMVFVLFRYGLVALAVGIFVLSTLGGGYPISADPSAWYSWPSVVVLIGLVAAASWGFRLSLGGQKVLGGLE
jgi:hypothetical protein